MTLEDKIREIVVALDRPASASEVGAAMARKRAPSTIASTLRREGWSTLPSGGYYPPERRCSLLDAEESALVDSHRAGRAPTYLDPLEAEIIKATRSSSSSTPHLFALSDRERDVILAMRGAGA